MTPRSERFRPDIQGLRAIAVLAVVLFHAGLPVPGGFAGVDIFFVISGFVITSMLVGQWAADDRLRMLAFSARRFKRLTPALATMVTTTLVLAVVLQSPMGPQQTTARTALGAMALAANFVIAATTGDYFDDRAEMNPLLNTWSLSVEEQFYLVFPALLFGLWWVARRWSRRSVALAGLTVIIVLSFVAALASTRMPGVLPGPDALYGFYGPLSRGWEFALGALVALVLSGLPSPRAAATGTQRGLLPSRAAAAMSITGGLCIVASLWILSPATPGPGIRNLLPVIGTALVILGGRDGRGPIFNALASRPMRWLGDRSYSWYLWHWPLIVMAALVWPDLPLIPLVAAAISLPVAMAAYRWIEQPLRSWQPPSARAWRRLLACVIGPPVVLAGVVLFVCSHYYWSERIAMFSGNWASSHADRLAGCFLEPRRALRGWPQCTWNAQAQGPPIYLLGDSNAGHFSEAVITAGERLGRPVTIRTIAGCPFLVLDAQEVATAPEEARNCAQTIDEQLAWLAKQPPGLVITSSSTYPWAPPAQQRKPDTDMASVTVDYLALRQQQTIARLQDLGSEVLVVQTVPQFVVEPHRLYYQDCSLWRALASGCKVDMPRTFADQVQRTTRIANVQATQLTGAALVDLRDDLCPADVCSNVHDGEVWYQDSGHLSVAGSEALAARFTDEIGRLGS